MPKEPKHHYIPIFYLQQWAGKDGRLIEFCRRYQGVVARPTFPDGTGYVRGLYKLPGSAPGDEYIIETKLMSDIDNRAAKALQRMMVDGEAPGKLEEQDALGWCQFLYSLIVRNPEHLLRMKEKLQTLEPGEVLENIREDYPNIRQPSDPETFDEYKEAFLKNPVEIPSVRVLPELVRSKRVVRVLASFKWATHTVRTAEHSLLTSDRPIIMSNGLSQQDAFILLPISPRRVFIATKDEETVRSITSMPSDKIVEAVNNQIAQQAHRFVFGQDNKQLRFVSKRIGKRVWSSPLG
ncbi:MAG TPA: DUF4238 domain-containing protein [Xanthobacteraceae bacterium]|nr:DUF4238 domain-containing protein [Xanthobacteraceae bacterium]